MDADDLNSLTDSILGDLTDPGDTLGLPSAAPLGQGRAWVGRDREEKLNELNKLLKSTTSPEKREILRAEAWACFKCKTVNGLVVTRREVRKTCRKCSKPRTGEPSLYEELVGNDHPNQVEPS